MKCKVYLPGKQFVELIIGTGESAKIEKQSL
jgi:hypothetical protein